MRGLSSWFRVLVANILGFCLLVFAQSDPRAVGQRWANLGPEESELPLRIGRRMQLLVDNEILSDFHYVRRVMGQVRKHSGNPVLQADRPWERHAASGGGLQVASALYDSADGLFKLWYNILQPQAFGGSGVAYATSRNGVAWSKPNLGLVEFGEEKDNNLCRLDPFGTLVRGLQLIRDSRPRPETQRYLVIGV